MTSICLLLLMIPAAEYSSQNNSYRQSRNFQKVSDTLEATYEGQVGVVEGPDEYQFGVVGDLAADRDGRLFVLDPMYFRVQVYDTMGAYFSTIGRQGRGPGEFLYPRQLAVGPDGTLAVSDDRKMVFLLFSPDGTPSRNIRLSGGGHYFDGIWLDAEQRIYDGRQGWGDKKDHSFVLAIPTKQSGLRPSIDTLPIPMRSTEPILISTRIGYEGYVPQPFSVRTMWTVLPDGRVVATNGQECEFDLIDRDLARSISCESQPVLISSGERDRQLATIRENIRLQARAGQANPHRFLEMIEAPTHYPAILHVTSDHEGRIWLAVPSDRGRIIFKVFSSDGEFLTHVRLPSQDGIDLSAVVVGGNWLYARAILDPELGVHGVRRFRIPIF